MWMDKLPIIWCKECERLTLEVMQERIEECECPVLCDSCSERVQRAWVARRNRGISLREMHGMMARD